MHGKSQADEWRRYIASKMNSALSRGSAWFMAGLAFVVVYRAVFETILFYAALWTQGNGGTILAGAMTAMLLLAIITWVILRYRSAGHTSECKSLMRTPFAVFCLK